LKRKIYSTAGLNDSYELKNMSPSSGDEGEDEESTNRDVRKKDKDKDLYSWMVRQQRGTMKADHVGTSEVTEQMRPIETADVGVPQPNLLVDTRVIFAPLLTSVDLCHLAEVPPFWAESRNCVWRFSKANGTSNPLRVG